MLQYSQLLVGDAVQLSVYGGFRLSQKVWEQGGVVGGVGVGVGVGVGGAGSVPLHAPSTAAPPFRLLQSFCNHCFEKFILLLKLI